MALVLDNPFWQFSLRVYGTSGVAQECLDLQDCCGIDVNVMLYALWLGAERGRAFTGSDLGRLADQLAVWSAAVVQPLRAVRRKLKDLPDISDPAVQALRKQVAGAELYSEQIEQALLYALKDGIGRPAAIGAVRDDIVRDNAEALLVTHETSFVAFPMRATLAAAVAMAAVPSATPSG